MSVSDFRIRRPKGFFDYARIYALYISAFPADERKPFAMIRANEKHGKTDVWILEKNGRFAGFSSTVNGTDKILLDYLAVSKKKRGQGAGSAGIRKMLRIYEGKGFFVEIESVIAKLPGAEEREKRRRFYIANGFEPMNVFASVFGVDMEILGIGCRLTFDEYRAFYKDYYSNYAAQHINLPKFPPET